jgi:transcriptional regulator with XRE-family HTH domain
MAQADLAKRVGVSKATIAAYCANKWTVLDRTVLERITDVLQCDAGTLLATQESHFFDSYLDHPGANPICIYLRRPDADTMVKGRRLGHRDYLAIGRVDGLLKDGVEGMGTIEETASTPAEFNERIRQDCVIRDRDGDLSRFWC